MAHIARHINMDSIDKTDESYYCMLFELSRNEMKKPREQRWSRGSILTESTSSGVFVLALLHCLVQTPTISETVDDQNDSHWVSLIFRLILRSSLDRRSM